MTNCTVIDCKNKHWTRGYCALHYHIMRKDGSISKIVPVYNKAEYQSWKDMKSRCYYKKHKTYKNYGGRGIKVCDEWLHNFKEFYNYVGDRPTTQHTIDRIDNDGNYEPGNVRWATKTQQVVNRRCYSKYGYTGVYLTPYNMWESRIVIDGQFKHLGNFRNQDDAIKARIIAESTRVAL